LFIVGGGFFVVLTADSVLKIVLVVGFTQWVQKQVGFIGVGPGVRLFGLGLGGVVVVAPTHAEAGFELAAQLVFDFINHAVVPLRVRLVARLRLGLGFLGLRVAQRSVADGHKLVFVPFVNLLG